MKTNLDEIPPALNVKVLEKLKALACDTPGLHGASLNAAKKNWKRLRLQFPAETEFLGQMVPQAWQTRVRKFRCLAPPRSPEEPERVRLQMQLRDRAYNDLVEAARPLIEKILALAGPQEREYRRLRREEKELYRQRSQRRAELWRHHQEISETEEESQKRLTAIEEEDATLQAIQAKISGVTRTINDLRSPREKSKGKEPLPGPEEVSFREEIRATRQSAEWKALYEQLMALLTSIARHYKSGKGGHGLYGPNYDAVANQFRGAVNLCLRDEDAAFRALRFRHESRRPVVNEQGEILRWEPQIAPIEYWDQTGALSVAMSHEGSKNQQLETVFNGTNRYLRMRPLTASDLPAFPDMRTKVIFPETVDELRGTRPQVENSPKRTERLFVASVRIGTEKRPSRPVLASAPVIYHNPLPPGARVIGASFLSQRVAGRIEHFLTISYQLPKPTASTGVEATLVLDPAFEGRAFAHFERQDGEEFSRWVREGDPGGRGSRVGGRVPAWITSDGYLEVICWEVGTPGGRRQSPIVGGAQEIRERLQHHLDTYANLTMTLLKRELAQPGLTLPAWYREHHCHVFSKKAMLRTFRLWRHFLNEARPEARDEYRHLSTWLMQQSGERAKLVQDGCLTLGQKLDQWAEVARVLSSETGRVYRIPPPEAYFLTLLFMHYERQEHLHRWAANVETSALRHRKNEYRRFARKALDGVGVLKIVEAPLRKRYLSDKQKQTAPSELLLALEHRASLTGTKITQERMKKPKPTRAA